MSAVGLLGLLVLGVVVLTPLAERILIPQPVLLTVYGLGLGLVPAVPTPHVRPDLVLPLVLPPLLFAAAQTTSLRELRQAAKAILALAVGLTVLSAGAVAVVAHAFGLPWGVAAVLGAAVAPPDPVAATAVAGRLHLPRRLVTILEGEGEFNDATALLIYQLSVMAVVVGGVTLGQVGLGLVIAVLGGLAIGFAGGWLARWALRLLRDPATETTVTLVLPFAAYLAADQVHASGVLAVLVVGLFLRSTATRALTSGGWVLGRSVWQYVEFAVSGLLFAFLGLQLERELSSASVLRHGEIRWLTVAVVAALLVVRAVAMFAAAVWHGRRSSPPGAATPRGWREATVASWAGMRGVVTVATVLALPATVDGGGPFPARSQVVLVGLLVVVGTLVLQGLTLAPLIRGLGVAGEADVRLDVRRLQRTVAEAALEQLRSADDVPEQVRDAVVRQYESRLGYRNQVLDIVDGEGGGEGGARQLRRLLERATEAEREAVLEARRRGDVSTAAADAVLFDIEARALRYES